MKGRKEGRKTLSLPGDKCAIGTSVWCQVHCQEQRETWGFLHPSAQNKILMAAFPEKLNYQEKKKSKKYAIPLPC